MRRSWSTNIGSVTLTYTFRLARLVADLPKLKAGVVTGDPPTVQPLVDDYRTQMNVDLLVVSDRQGQVLGSAGAEGATLPGGSPGRGRRANRVRVAPARAA